MRSVVILALLALSQPAWAQPVVGAVDALTGTATITHASAAAAQLQIGAAVAEGDLLHTGPNARLRLRLSDGSNFTLGADSALRFEHLAHAGQAAPTRLQHLLGYVRAVVAPQHGTGLEIDTDSDAAAVRGTEWIQRTEPGTTEIFVAAGRVAIRGMGASTGRAVVLAPGQGVTFHSAGPHTTVVRWAPPKVAAFQAATQLP